MTKKKSTFSLIELVVVIAIITILITIATIYIKDQVSKTRDAKRIWWITSIAAGLSTYFYSSWTLPYPDDKISIVINWVSNVMGYQWYYWKILNDILKNSSIPTDPEWSYYTYRLDSTWKKFQIMWLFENEKIHELYMPWTTQNPNIKKPKLIWENLWVILDNNLNPIQNITEIKTLWYLDIASTTNTYNVYMNDDTNIIWTWLKLSTILIANDNLVSQKDNALISYWAIDERNGPIIKDFSKNNNTWILSGIVTRNEWLKQYAIWFTKGKSGFIQVNNSSSLQPTNAISISVRIKPGNTYWEWENTGIICKGIISWTPDYCITHETRTWFDNKKIYWYINWTAAKITTSLDRIDSWQHIVLTYDKTNLKIYINWTLKETLSYTSNINTSTSPIYIWKADTSSQYYKWNIDEIRIYNRALSTEEISALYKLQN